MIIKNAQHEDTKTRSVAQTQHRQMRTDVRNKRAKAKSDLNPGNLGVGVAIDRLAHTLEGEGADLQRV